MGRHHEHNSCLGVRCSTLGEGEAIRGGVWKEWQDHVTLVSLLCYTALEVLWIWGDSSMQPNTKDNTQKQVFFTIVGGLALVGIGFFGNVVTSKIDINILVALTFFIICVLLSLWCSVNLLPSGMEIILGGGKAPITIWRVCAGVCFLLSWSFVILIFWSFGSQWLSNYFQPHTFISSGTPPPPESVHFRELVPVVANIIAAIIVIGLWVVLPISVGIYLIRKDYKRFPNGKLGFSETRVLVLALLVIFNVFVVTCIGVLSWLANGGGCCSYPDIFINVVGTMRILALALAIGVSFLHYALFLLRKV
jgi:hypothetical protein